MARYHTGRRGRWLLIFSIPCDMKISAGHDFLLSIRHSVIERRHYFITGITIIGNFGGAVARHNAPSLHVSCQRFSRDALYFVAPDRHLYGLIHCRAGNSGYYFSRQYRFSSVSFNSFL